MTNLELLDEARKAREFSYCPYSNWSVGAALLAKNGTVYYGCNVENSAYSPSVCAERTAIFKAVSEGNLEFEKIAVVGGAKGETAYNLCSPCGVCREVMSEFCDPDTFEIVMSNGKESCVVMTLGELLPGNFGFTELER